MFDVRHEHVRLRLGNSETDAPFVARRNTVLDLLPRRARIDGFVDGAPGAAAVESVRLAEPLIHRGVQHLWVARVHHDVGRAGERVGVQHLRPAAAGVGGFVHAPLGVATPEISNGGNVGNVRIGGVQHHAPN